MHQRWRTIFILSGGAGMLIGVALILSGTLPFLPDSLRMALSVFNKMSETAATALGVSQGLPVYDGGYPSPLSCNTGDSLCYPNTRIGVFSVRNQGGGSGTGLTNYINFQNATGSIGTSVTLQSLNPTTVEWSCQPSQSVSTYNQQTCYQQCDCWWDSYGGVWCSSCPDECGSWSTSNYTFASSISIKDPQGVSIIDSASLYGTQSGAALGGTAGTYDADQTVNYSLTCNGASSNPVTVPVTMGSTITQTTLSANPTIVRAWLDQSTLTVTAASAVEGSCKIVAPDGSTLKTYSGTSVNDTVQVGPFGSEPITQTYQIVCTGPEGFNSRKSVNLTVKLPPILSITANYALYKILIPPVSSADIRWTSNNQAPNSCSVSYSTTGGSCITTAKTISTNGAYNWKTFTIGTDIYLALANAYSGISYNVDSAIYKWIPSLSCFGKDAASACGTAYQSIATSGAAKWESFTIGSNTYLALANSRDDTTRSVNSKIYKWTSSGAECPTGGGLGNGTACTAAYQSIATNGAVDLKPITVGADTYLAAANYRNDTSYGINSNIYKWISSGTGCPAGGGFGAGTACGSVLQAIPTKGAYRMESFTLEGNSYLAVTNAFDPTAGVGYNQPSYIYKYIGSGNNCPSGGGWGNSEYGSCGTPFQTINTSGAYGWKYFVIGTMPYLAVANAYNGTSFNISSKIYQWMASAQCFGDGTTCGSAFQTIPTSGATQLQTFTTGPDTYLIAANAYNGTSYNTSSNFYQWMPGSRCFGNNTACGIALQSIPTSGTSWWEPVTISGDIYLATANYYNGTTRNISSSIMKWSPSGCGDDELGTPTVWTADNSGSSGSPTIVTFNSTPAGGTWTAPSGVTSVAYLVVAGGGGSPGGNITGGGGGGGMRAGALSVTPGATYTVTVGAGGLADTSVTGDGGNSVFGSITAIGGGAGGNGASPATEGSKGRTGGSGGGSGNASTYQAPGTVGQGNSGGGSLTVDNDAGGGGGGAGAAGATGGASTGGAGGNGLASSISGSSVTYAGGGGGGAYFGSHSSGGTGGGGAGGYGTSVDSGRDGAPGTANTGGGAGGSGYNGGGGLGAAGGSGVVIISYNILSSYPTGLFSGSRLYTLTCKWLDGITASSTSVKVTTQTELQLSANGSSTPTVYITPDTSALIQWSTKSVQQNSCNVTNTADASNWAADNNPTGYPSPVLADGQSVTYTLACVDLSGAPVSKVMTVTGATPLPSSTSDMSISVKRVVRGGRPTITWSVVNLNPGVSCTVTPALQSGIASWDGTGTSWSSPLGGALGPIINVTTTFTLVCVNKAGNSASVSATAYLVPAFKEL